MEMRVKVCYGGLCYFVDSVERDVYNVYYRGKLCYRNKCVNAVVKDEVVGVQERPKAEEVIQVCLEDLLGYNLGVVPARLVKVLRGFIEERISIPISPIALEIVARHSTVHGYYAYAWLEPRNKRLPRQLFAEIWWETLARCCRLVKLWYYDGLSIDAEFAEDGGKMYRIGDVAVVKTVSDEVVRNVVAEVVDPKELSELMAEEVLPPIDSELETMQL